MARIWNAITRNSEYAGLVIEEDAGEFLPVHAGVTFTRQPTLEKALCVISLASGISPLIGAERPRRMTVGVNPIKDDLAAEKAEDSDDA